MGFLFLLQDKRILFWVSNARKFLDCRRNKWHALSLCAIGVALELNNHVQVKGLSKEELEARNDLVSAMKERIEAIPDGSTAAAKNGGATASASSYTGIKFDSTFGNRFGG